MLAEQINQFYLEAFNHALVVVGIVFGVVGVVVPAGIAIFQARQGRHEIEQLKTKISAEVADAVAKMVGAEKDSLLKEQAAALVAFQERSDKVVADLREEVSEAIARNRGGAFHVQALAALNANQHAVAVKSACEAIPNYLRGKDFSNLRTVCAQIAIPSFRKFHGGSLGKHKSRFVESCEEAISTMRAADSEGNLHDLVRDLQDELEACLEREGPADDTE